MTVELKNRRTTLVWAFVVVGLLVAGALAKEKKEEVTTYEYWMEYYANHPSGAQSRPITEESEPFNPIDHIPLIGLTSAAIVITGACIAACVLVAYGKWKYPDAAAAHPRTGSPPSDASYSGGDDLSDNDDDLETQISISESPIPGHGPDPLNDNDLGLDDEDEDDDDFGHL